MEWLECASYSRRSFYGDGEAMIDSIIIGSAVVSLELLPCLGNEGARIGSGALTLACIILL